MDSDEILKARLDSVQSECDRLRQENAELRLRLGEPPAVRAPVTSSSIQHEKRQSTATVTAESRPDLKVSLFANLFRGRDDVYAVRWEGRNGQTGYSPAGIRDWSKGTLAENGRKRTLRYSKLFPLTEEVIKDHLLGRHTVGVYPLLPDDTCWFVAVDFDKRSWEADAGAFVVTCGAVGVPTALERSRSGQGAHAWIFFSVPTSAALARRLASALLTRTMERRYSIGLDSYDRLFPSQDTMPKGGFGNLIALPLQRSAREKGNSVFIDDQFQPHEDQWAFLSSVKRLTPDETLKLTRAVSSTGDVIGVRRSALDDDDASESWTMPSPGPSPTRLIKELLPHSVSIKRANMLYVEKKDLPSAFIDRLIRLAAF